jgi:hypothetical protein
VEIYNKEKFWWKPQNENSRIILIGQ